MLDKNFKKELYDYNNPKKGGYIFQKYCEMYARLMPDDWCKFKLSKNHFILSHGLTTEIDFIKINFYVFLFFGFFFLTIKKWLFKKVTVIEYQLEEIFNL